MCRTRRTLDLSHHPQRTRTQQTTLANPNGLSTQRTRKPERDLQNADMHLQRVICRVPPNESPWTYIQPLSEHKYSNIGLHRHIPRIRRAERLHQCPPNRRSHIMPLSACQAHVSLSIHSPTLTAQWMSHMDCSTPSATPVASLSHPALSQHTPQQSRSRQHLYRSPRKNTGQQSHPVSQQHQSPTRSRTTCPRYFRS